MAEFDWKLREHLHEFRADGRLFVLMSIYLHANLRLRSYPGYELIKLETGLSNAAVTSSIKWLMDSCAIYNVPYNKRVGVELKLPPRKYVYQLTGLILLNGRFVPYLYLKPESWKDLFVAMRELGYDDVLPKALKIEALKIEALICEGKVFTESLDLEGSKALEGRNAPARPRDPTKDSIVEQVENHAAWKAFVAGWDEQPIPPEVPPNFAETYLEACSKLYLGMAEGHYTLDDVTTMVRQKLKKQVKGGYRFNYVKADLPDYLSQRGMPAAAMLAMGDVPVVTLQDYERVHDEAMANDPAYRADQEWRDATEAALSESGLSVSEQIREFERLVREHEQEIKTT